MRLSRLLPDTLVGRTLLVLVAGLFLSQLAGIVLFELNRHELANHMGRRQIADHIAAHVQVIEATPEADRLRVLQAGGIEGLHVRYGPVAEVVNDDAGGEAALIREDLLRQLPGHRIHAVIGRPEPPRPDSMGAPSDRRVLDLQDRRGPPPIGEPGGGPRDRGPGDHHPGPMVHVSVSLSDGNWLSFVAFGFAGEPFSRLGFLAPLISGFLVVVVLSVLAVRRASKPLGLLADAAERLGRDVATQPMPVQGPREVRAAAVAFNDMQDRLRRFIEDRTQMIAAISHDLRTPITRMKLRAEFVEDEELRDKMLADLDEMESMIAQTLSFARDDATREARKSVDLAVLLAELCAQFGAPYVGPESLIVRVGPTAIKRAFANILENARKYGGGSTLTLTEQDAAVVAVVDDNGTGIPEPEFERVFQPFVRLEGSRNRDTGGTGLGLAVARTALRAHGGDIELSNRPEGGLRVTVTLPR